MAKIINSKFKLVKRYARFSNTCVYLRINQRKKVRYGYKVYQKIFRRYRSRKTIRINVRKPRVSIKRKTSFGKALEIKEKFSYLLGGIHSNKIKRYVHLAKAKAYSPLRVFLEKLESRLDILVYRINVIREPRLIKWLIRLGYVKVNGKVKTRTCFNVKQHSFVDVKLPSFIYRKVKKLFKESVKKSLVFKPHAQYAETSYKLFRTIVHGKPTEKNVFYPFNFKAYYFFRLYPK
jgi:ribosomal protein S4